MIATKNILIICLFFSLASVAQVDTLALKKMKPATLKKLGKNAMLQNDYDEAIPYFEQYNRFVKNDYKVQFYLAEAYRHVRDYKRAETMYALAYKTNPEKNITALYYEAQMNKDKGEYDKAKDEFSDFKKKYKGPDRKLKKQVVKDIESCDTAKIILSRETKMLTTHLDTTINKVHVEASPVTLDQNTLLYSSLRTDKKEYIIEGDTNNALVRKFYIAKKEGDKWKFSGEWDANMNVPGESVGNAAFSPDGKRMYFTRCKPDWAGRMICALYVSENENGTWSEPQKLDKRINNPKYNSTQPTVAIEPTKGNEIVYFVSNRKEGGRGGNDIWYFIYDKKKKIYKEPKNAGAKINTSSDEMSPYFDTETGALYFSSEGWTGLGGFDVFKSIGETKKWTPPENLGSPVNSGADDIFYTVSKNREEGFFVSNREGGNSIKNTTCCDDIYQYKYKEYIHLDIKGKIKEMLDSATTADLSGATVELYLKKFPNDKFLVKAVTADDVGLYNMSLEAGQDYIINVKKDGFLSSSKEISTRNIDKSQTLSADFKLQRIPKEAIRLLNIEYEFNKADLTPNSQIVLDTTLVPLLNSNPQIIVELGAHTDNKGADAYNLKLSQKRAESVVNYLISKGISKDRLKAVGYGETQPIAPNENPDGSDNPEGRQHNRRTEFKIIGELNQEIIYGNDDE